MKHLITVLLLLITLFMLQGCTSSGAFLSLNQTSVNLEENNYSIVVPNLTGSSEAAYILGLSYSSGLVTNTLAIARVNGTAMLYAEALQNLWDNYEAQHGSVEGNHLALTNIRYDSDILNLIVYTKVTLTVRADVVEFE
ncbi:MAG: DUF6567 family protein [Balneolaceae bacterium]|nr:DUF6567 family protein [Balneolaceae bacterium]